MFLLQSVEQRLGLINTWSAYILNILFVDEPAVNNVRILAAFFYGNGVPLHMATQLYEVCNNTCNLNTIIYMSELYAQWSPSVYLPTEYGFHMFRYYDISKSKHFWVNKKYLYNQTEEDTHSGTIPLGITNTGCYHLIYTILRSVQFVVLDE
jgi:hypothetical protein